MTPKQQAAMQQEPVAWMHNEIEGNIITHRPSDIDRHPERWTALYKEPPEQRKPLSDEEIDRLWRDPQQGYWDYRKFARAVEAKLKEKNT